MKAQSFALILLLVLIVLTATWLFRMRQLHNQVALLQSDARSLFHRLEELKDGNEKLAETLTGLKAEISGITAELAVARQEIVQSAAIKTGIKMVPADVAALARINVADIESGVFTFESDVTLLRSAAGIRSMFTKTYTVYAIKTDLGHGGRQLPFVIGIATCLGTPQFFVDYDGDCNVDLDIMRQLVEFIPYGSVLTRNFNIHNSQSIYNLFLLRHRDANFIPQDEIAERAGKLPNTLFETVKEHSDVILHWGQDDKEKGEEK